MTLDLISRAEARIAEIDQQRKELEYEQHELETALKVLHRFLDETASPGEKIIEGMQEALAVARGVEEPARVHTVPQPSPAAQTVPGSSGLHDAEAAPASVESAASNPEAKASTDSGATAQATEGPADSVTGDVSRASRAPGPGCNVVKEDVTAGETATSISPTPVTLIDGIAPKLTLADKIKALFAERGQITMREARAAIPDASEPGLWNAAKKAGLKFRHLTKEERSEIARQAMRRSAGQAADGQEASPEPEPPQTPEPPPTLAPERHEVKHIALTLKDRVRLCHQQHPNWTARMIANEIGAPYTSVSTTLGQVRSEGRKAEAHNPAKKQPEFANRQEMLAHYGDIAKRLGKPA